MKRKFDGELILCEILYIILLIFGMEFAAGEIIDYIDAGGFDMPAEWMEILKTGVIGAAIGGVASLVGSYFMYLGKSKKILEIVQELKGERFNQLREDGKGISQKADKLSSEHVRLQEELGKIYLNQEREKAVRDATSRQIPEEGKLLDLVKMVYDNHTKLVKRNAELVLEVKQLREELEQYRAMDRQADMEYQEHEVQLDEGVEI